MLPLAVYAKEPVIRIVPQPASIELQGGTFKAIGASVNCDAAFDEASRTVAQDFAARMSLATGKVSSFAVPFGISASAEAGKIKGFVFIRDTRLADEEYRIEIGKKSTIVRASGFHGVLYAVETIKQMLPEAIYGKSVGVSADWRLPCAVISDRPRFSYRGMHLDCARHFFSVDAVKRYLGIMAVYKLNRFHWHLSDDQGWRVEIKRYPELTLVGGYRSGTMIGRDFNSDDGIRYGGYYTQDQIREIVEYASKLGITVIPEIDLPGHMLAALSAYPWLGCSGGPYEAWHKWGVADEVLCAGKETTYEFLENVLSEIAELFPSEYIHIGGDECPKTEWENCPHCQAKIAELGLKDDDRFSAEQYLQCYVTSRMQDFLATKGKKIIGWDEILEGELAEGATVMSWRGVDGGREAASNGFDAIMTPTSYCYFDYMQSKDTDREPVGIGGYLPLEKVYGFDPLEGLPAGAEKHILGVQANLWTEYIAAEEHLQYMLLPRLMALSEVQWCEPANKDFEGFKSRLAEHELKILEAMGYNYRRLD
ncbi:MAG: beta-N-acetylhexosaminidase [Bacteroidales bacterium]|nr:beta-N-acetylhexosaminidase [Bacteroidales bacterium]